MVDTVYALYHGRVLCAEEKLNGVPSTWPPGHRWASIEDFTPEDGRKSWCGGCEQAIKVLRRTASADQLEMTQLEQEEHDADQEIRAMHGDQEREPDDDMPDIKPDEQYNRRVLNFHLYRGNRARGAVG